MSIVSETSDVPRFSLILATYGNAADEIPRFVDSLVAQNGAHFELIVVDQNADNHVGDILSQYSGKLDIVHVRASPGLSAARNVGLRLARGEIIAFPDDDCHYPAGVLETVANRLDTETELDGITGRCSDEQGRLAAGAEDKSSGYLTKVNVWQRGVSVTLFLRRNLVQSVGEFDEELGLGAKTPFQSGEETDYLLRAIAKGNRIYYDPELSVFHPLPPPNTAPGSALKAWRYGLGMGRVLRKHAYSPAQIAGYILTPFAGALVALLKRDVSLARVRIARTLGRYRGWRANSGTPIEPPTWVMGGKTAPASRSPRPFNEPAAPANDQAISLSEPRLRPSRASSNSNR